MTSANPLPPQAMSFDDFLAWEGASNDTLDFKRIYVDIAGDLVAGLALSEIIYWHLPNKDGDSKLRVYHKEHYWIASTRYEWWDRARITPRQIDHAFKILRQKQLIETHIFKFKGEPTIHIRLLMNPFLILLSEALNHPIQNPFLPKLAKPFSPKRDSPIAYTELMHSLQEANPVTEGIALGISNKNIVCRQILDDTNDNAKDKSQSSADNSPLPAESKSPSGTKTKNIEWNRGNESLENDEEIDYAIQEVWETKSPGRIEKLRKTLLGQHPRDSEFYICNVEPPASANEIRQMGEYFLRQYPGAEKRMPTLPEKIQDWLYKSREMKWGWIPHKKYIINTHLMCPADIFDSGDYEAHMAFMKRYHPNEYALCKKEIQYIDTELQSPTEPMILRPTVTYRHHTFDLPNPIPVNVYNSQFNQGMVEMLKYFKATDPETYAALQKSIKEVDEELANQS